MTINHKPATVLVSTFAAFVFLTSASSAATAEQASDSDQALPVVDMANVDVVSKLDSQGQRLYRLGVYPEGTEDPEAQTAAGIFRAELVRAFPDQIAGVVLNYNEAGDVVGATVHAIPSSALSREGLDKATGTLPSSFASALKELDAASGEVAVAADATYSVLEACEIEEVIRAGDLFNTVALPEGAGVTFVIDEATGRLIVGVGDSSVEAVTAWASKFGNAVTVEGLGGDLVRQGRADSYSPRYGGSRIYNTGTGFSCTDSFRMNTNTLLSANHCGNGTWVAPAGSGTTGVMSNSYSLGSAGIDINLVYGQSYSNRVWQGTVSGTTTRAVVGFITEPSVPDNGTGYYRFSGSFSGSGTGVVIQKYVSGCYPGGLECSSHMYHLVTTDPICVDGDSGGAWQLWNSTASDPYAAMGVQVAGTKTAPVPGNTRHCYAVGMEVITYLYGGITIG